MAFPFITFEGGEGSGKSTQTKRLAEYLENQGQAVCLTREPGGTPAGEKLRELLVSGDDATWSAEAEALLMSAARDAHVRDVIRPALAAGKTVICDRFMDSTRVYQGHAGGCSHAFIQMLEDTVVGATRPDRTLVFDLDPGVGLARAAARSQGHGLRFENKGLAYHQKLREGFLTLARDNPLRCRIIDAAQSEDQVFAQVLRALDLRHV